MYFEVLAPCYCVIYESVKENSQITTMKPLKLVGQELSAPWKIPTLKMEIDAMNYMQWSFGIFYNNYMYAKTACSSIIWNINAVETWKVLFRFSRNEFLIDSIF